MLFDTEALERRREIFREFDAGTIDTSVAGARLIEADPDSGVGYLLLGNGQLVAGELSAAESSYWKALERSPFDYAAYFALSQSIGVQHGDGNATAGRLMYLGVCKLALSPDIPDDPAEYFRERGKTPGLDFKDPLTYEALAEVMEPQTKKAARADDRLLPYELLNSLHRQAEEGVDPGLLRKCLQHTKRLIPLWRAALREWIERSPALSLSTFAMSVALLGETAGPEMLDELLELAPEEELAVCLHVNWAIWRIGQRFPAETLAKFRAAAVAAPPLLRCALAEQLGLLPRTPGIRDAVVELLEGFADFAHKDNAEILFSLVIETLHRLGEAETAESIHRQYQPLLPADSPKLTIEDYGQYCFSDLVNEEIFRFTIADICTQRLLFDDVDEEELDDEEDEDEDEEFIEPVVAPVRPGRNEPCWCGSGKKYKKCHLAADEAPDRSDTTRAEAGPGGEPIVVKLHKELLSSDLEWRGKGAINQAALLYFGHVLEELDPQSDTTALEGFWEWYFHDFRPVSTGPTLAEEYLKRRGARLNSAERELLEAWVNARFAIWEAQRIEKGTGLELKNLFGGETIFVHDVSCSRSVIRWDCVLGRVYRLHGRWYLTGILIDIPRPLLPALTEQIERESVDAGMPAEEFVRANSHRWHRVIPEIAQKQLAGLQVVNAEGDELEMCAAEYLVKDRSAVVAALEAVDGFEVEEENDAGCWLAWVEPGTGEQRRAYGSIEIRDGKLRLECNSRDRLRNGRDLLEQHAGRWLQHTLDSFRSLDEMKREASDKQSRDSGLTPEGELELVNDFLSAHYAKWVDERLPALGGKTPREAARSKAGRRELEDLLRLMENGEERTRREGGPAFDFSAVRKSLGM